MVVLTVLVVVDVLRWLVYDDDTSACLLVLVLSLAVALLALVGGTTRGSLAYDYGFNVEASGDHAFWPKSETDVFPVQKG